MSSSARLSRSAIREAGEAERNPEVYVDEVLWWRRFWVLARLSRRMLMAVRLLAELHLRSLGGGRARDHWTPWGRRYDLVIAGGGLGLKCGQSLLVIAYKCAAA